MVFSKPLLGIELWLIAALKKTCAFLLGFKQADRARVGAKNLVFENANVCIIDKKQMCTTTVMGTHCFRVHFMKILKTTDAAVISLPFLVSIHNSCVNDNNKCLSLRSANYV